MTDEAQRILSPAPVSPSRISRMISTSGLLKTDYFVLKAGEFQLELDPGNFELLGLRAEGNVEVRMISKAAGEEQVVVAQNATYRSRGKRLVLDGWKGISCESELLPFEPAGESILTSGAVS